MLENDLPNMLKRIWIWTHIYFDNICCSDQPLTFYWTSVRSSSTLVTNYELIPVLLDLIDVTLADDSRLVDGLTRIMLITSNNGCPGRSWGRLMSGESWSRKSSPWTHRSNSYSTMITRLDWNMALTPGIDLELLSAYTGYYRFRAISLSL